MRSRVAVLSALAVLSCAAWVVADRPQPGMRQARRAAKWYKGNTHTHTLNSDGDSAADEVVRWYREHGYQFLVLTDHNFLTDVDGVNTLLAAEEKFVVIKGEEVTDRFDARPIHINALDLPRPVDPQHGTSVSDVLQRNVDAIRTSGGVPQVDHPNYEWAISGADLLRLERLKLFEIYNGHPLVNNLGGGGVPGMEEVWDRLLSSGRIVYGVADDDAHVFKQPGNPAVAGPGRGWVCVRAERLAPRPIVEALERGDFYASTGVELTDYDASDRGITITIAEQGTARYRVQFIGADGRPLKEETSSPATYLFAGDEKYVRAKIVDSNGHAAWTQPVVRSKPVS